jgi:hypothetical protein
VVDGQEVTRERKLLAWAGDMAVQRSELRRTRMELAQAREEIRVLRAELSVLRMEVRLFAKTGVRGRLPGVGAHTWLGAGQQQLRTLSGVQSI